MFAPKGLTADQVTARGVTIQTGATFNLSDLGTTPVQQPTRFVLINNTSAGPINGTFSNIAEGQVIQIGPNTHKFSYVGGPGGNDFVDDSTGGVVIAIGEGAAGVTAESPGD